MDSSQADGERSRTLGPIEVLVLCTANQCRSPMAEALLRDRLGAAGVDAVVRSAGELSGGVAASSGSVRAMAARGLDLAAHRSRTLTPDEVSSADLIVAMARRHLRAAVAMVPASWPRTFTLKELVRRGSMAGVRRPGQSFEDWLALVHAGRDRQSLLGDDPVDDVADPMGGPDRLYETTAAELARLIDTFIAVAFPRPLKASPAAADRSSEPRETA